MKIHLSRVVALSLLVSASIPVLAQPPKAVVPIETKALDNKRSVLNADALALIGNFYNKVRRAKSYRGRMVVEQTNTKNEKIFYQFNAEIKSIWLGDGKREDSLPKSITEYSTKLFQDDKTTEEKFSSLHDGSKNYRVDEINSLWSVKAQEVDTKVVPVDFALLPWSEVLMFFAAGSDFKIYPEIVDERNMLSVRNKGSLEFNFDAETGNLLSWSITGQFNGSISKTEYRWLETEFDVPLSDEVFTWKAPEGAKEVAPETMSFRRPF